MTQRCHSPFGQKTAGWSLQCTYAHYSGEERTSDLSTFLSSHGQYPYTNGPKLECKTWHSLFDLQVHIWGELQFCCQKNKISIILTLDFWNSNFLEGNVFGPHHLLLWHFVSTSYAKHQFSVSSNYRDQKVWDAFNCFNKVISVIRGCSFCSAVSACGTNHVENFHFCKSSYKLCCTIVFVFPVCSAMSLREDWCSSFKISTTRAMFFAHSCCHRSSVSLLIMNHLSPFWKRVVPTKHCSTTYSRLTINFLTNFNCFCGI